jgi:hypothetical protein
MAETFSTSMVDWTRFPTIDQFSNRYSSENGGRAREYVDYENALNAWVKGPQPQDFANKRDFATAQKAYLSVANKISVDTVNADLTGRILKGDRANTSAEFRNKSVAAAVELEKKKIPKRLEKEGIARDELDNARTFTSTVATESAAAEKATEDAPRARAVQLGSFAIPVPGSQGRTIASNLPGAAAINAMRAPNKDVTIDEWKQLWTTKTQSEKEEFRSTLVKAGIKDADIADLEDGIAATWNALGLFLGRQAKAGKKYDSVDVGLIKSFSASVEKSGSGGPAGPSAAEIAEDKAVAKTNMRQFYLNNGLPFSEKNLDRLASNVAYGKTTVNAEVERVVKTILVKQYPEWSEQLNAGYSVRQLAEPYIEAMAASLELDPDDVKVTDPMIQAAIQTKNEKGTYTSATLRDFELALRKDDRWQNTKAGTEWIAGVNNDLLQTFGLEK